ncbi:phosphonate ABC transporter ATP-binding protein [Paeniglutamicibacter terrestris]|uniref:Phosphonate ABC transporter ATP-binding protein n=1 Tax=Paeniglutamicibacter terrestris TaxID=2723403 RepID=A0ABX1G142_9MICC|nr:phosphonate ABC transporter ATP-binding protein [Paeniglutamicibacter terrestris]NKG19930.1 phosphonate ABC transporter ATP-binding protein [Paeniglutamicibacter terrestris]
MSLIQITNTEADADIDSHHSRNIQADIAIEATALHKSFGSTHALKGVDLKVAKGEMTVLLGLSGSGKSTLLRCLNGLHQLTSGEVTVLGEAVHVAKARKLRALRSRVGFIFQHFNLVNRLTCLENVLIGAAGRIRGPRYGLLSYTKAQRREALGHLERVGLGDLAFQRADSLSGGQQQRVAIARALMQKPELILADEPVASLDPQNAANVMDLLFQVCREDGITVVCTLHQVDLALQWANRIVGLRSGEKVLDESTASLSKERVLEVYQQLDPDAEITTS